MKTWKDQPITIVDTETTGTDVGVARIVEVAAVRMEGGRIVSSCCLLVGQEAPIPEEATAIHGITNEMAGNGPTFWDVAAEMWPYLSEPICSAFNARFDRAMLIAEHIRCKSPIPTSLRGDSAWIDPLVWDREFNRYAKGGHKLEAVAKRLGVEQSAAHRALGDCETTARVLTALMPHMPDDWDEMIATQRIAAAEHEARFQRWLWSQKQKEVV